MRRRTAAVALAAALSAAACGGSSSPTSATMPSTVASADPTKVAQLDASSFDAVVIGGTRPSLVEFHSPT